MIKGIIFDMDGVLIDAREWHYQAFNEALDLFGASIPHERHLSEFDGLPTSVKLKKLSVEGLIPEILHPLINSVKQERTLRIAAKNCFPNPSHVAMLSYLKNQNFKIGLATNSIKLTTMAMITYAGIEDFFHSILTNEDVKFAKPHPEIYRSSAAALGFKPEEILVVEDNVNGIQAATAAGCRVLEVKNPDDVHLDRVLNALELA